MQWKSCHQGMGKRPQNFLMALGNMEEGFSEAAAFGR